MLDDAVDLLDRQHAYIQRHQGRRLLVSLRRYVDVLLGDSRIRPMLEDLEAEAFAGLYAFSAAERKLADRLLPLADELVRLEPSADDNGLGPADADYVDSLANLRAHASAARDAPQPPDLAEPPLGDRSRVDTMLGILHRKTRGLRILTGQPPLQISETDLRPDLAGIEEARADVAGAYHAALRQLQHAAAGEAGFAFLRLRFLAREAGGAWPALDDPATMHAVRAIVAQHFPVRLLVAVDPVFHRLFSPELVGDVAAEVEELVAGLGQEEDLLHDELRRRLGTTRSRAAVVARFRQRCEWYDHAELAQLASEASGRAEAVLTNVLTRYLFDAGLNPISKPLTGRLETDILDPTLVGGFYVEVKQYDGSSARTRLRRGAWQAHDTLATLRQTRYDVREGFYVVFRRGGPRYVFPPSVPGEGWTLYPVLIDLAPDVGSRTTEQAQSFSVEGLTARPAPA